jgi:hypothetical protein
MSSQTGMTLFDLVLLQRQHRACRFSGVDNPPFETGKMWSNSRSRWGSAATDTEQYREERVNVGTERQATGRVRLRKYVVTET